MTLVLFNMKQVEQGNLKQVEQSRDVKINSFPKDHSNFTQNDDMGSGRCDQKSLVD